MSVSGVETVMSYQPERGMTDNARWPCPLPGDAGLKKQGDPLAMSLCLSSIRASQAAIVAALADPATLRGDYLPAAERQRYEECQRSIVESAVWFRP